MINKQELFEKVYDYEDETGLKFSLSEIKEDDSLFTGVGLFHLEDEFIGYSEFTLDEKENTFSLDYVNLGEFLNKGVMTRYILHLGPILKEFGIEYVTGRFYSAAITLAENNGGVQDGDKMIINVSEWNPN